MKKSFLLKFLIIAILFTCRASGQMNRNAQANNITSNIYQNAAHAITGVALQQVMLNQNNSYVNLLSDTNLLDVRIFSPYATYTPGMGAFHNDTLYINVVTAHGSWTSSDWIKVNGSDCACSTLVKYSDTNHNVATVHDISVATDPLIAWADTGIKIATTHSLAQSILTLIPFSDTGGTSPKIATLHSVSTSLTPYIPFSDTGTGSRKMATSYNLTSYSTLIGLHDSLEWYQQIKDSNAKGGYATTYYVSSHSGGLVAGDTVGGASHLGTHSQIVTNYSGVVLGGQVTVGPFITGTTNAEPIELMYNNSVISSITTNSFSWGYAGNAGGGSVAMGEFSAANDLNDVAIGYNGGCNGNYGIAIGYAAYSGTGTNAIALGESTRINSSSNICQFGTALLPIRLSYDTATFQSGGDSVMGSVSGSALFIQTQGGPHIKEVDVSLDALHGTANYTFPVPFTTVVDYIIYTNAAPGVVGVALSKTAVTITGGSSAPSGFIEIKGY